MKYEIIFYENDAVMKTTPLKKNPRAFHPLHLSPNLRRRIMQTRVNNINTKSVI